jgi:glycosyltransferase involved in cell wall biosynthesis
MKIAIAGTRGIPNNYGGFEQCAEFLSVLLAQKGHEVTVYSTHYHPFQDKIFKGVTLKHIYNPENKIGAAGNFIYDYLCMRDAVNNKSDILLVLGYTTASVFYPFMNFGKSVLITNMDGLEWKRDKWNSFVKQLAKWFENLGAKHSHYLVADNEKIKEYFFNKYHRESTYIAYGCEPFTNENDEVLELYGLEKWGYGILIARMEAENNIEMILSGFSASRETGKLIVVGNLVTRYAKRMVEKFGKDKRIVFKGGIYDLNHLNNLRHFSRYYFHGHSVGGTNPSLLEAMASGAFVIAHGNEFNKAILGDDAFYFNDSASLTEVLNDFSKSDNIKPAIESNLMKVKSVYNWDLIAGLYEQLFKQVLNRN